ncbi:hypothetical protein [Roseiconus lacunae]|uniref:Uncharacterized protein n=1 Tax=Roseiconus lacunae TaxID=2605694 RepID=A0ABT7PH74_9BACT|nr:hypothetical protein [Roseiconus lacunae]MDM4015832.1 hypothetical protein [Roseiconus lacunae]
MLDNNASPEEILAQFEGQVRNLSYRFRRYWLPAEDIAQELLRYLVWDRILALNCCLCRLAQEGTEKMRDYKPEDGYDRRFDWPAPPAPD